MNTTPYTDDQILEAIEKAMDTATSRDQLFVREVEDRELYWEAQREARLQIGKEFLKLLSKPQPEPEPDPYATLKAYAKAGARIRYRVKFGWTQWMANGCWGWGFPPENYQVHPADLHFLEAKTFTFAGLEWNKHTPGDPMPCEPEALVQVVLEKELDGRDEWRDETDLAREYDWGVETNEYYPIVGWRYANKPAQTWAPENAKAFEGFQAELRETWDTQPWTPAVGDVVQLKSGGPKMTCILRHAHQDTYLCSWASNHGVFERFFPLACLQQA